MRNIVFAIRLAVASLLLFAGLQKLLDPMAFAIAIASWELVPDPLAGPATPFVIALELATPVIWLRSPFTRAGALPMLASLVLFTGAYLLESVLHEPPRCSCFVQIARSAAHREDLLFVGGRNALLIGMLAFSLHFIPREAVPGAAAGGTA